jgi:anti-sigma B factor antagonist
MSLSISVRRVDNVVVLELSGRLSVLDPQLRQMADDLVARGERYFVINLANVSYLDNSGLGQLCLFYTIARNRGGDLKLLRPTERIRKLLSVTKLNTIFESFDAEADAIRAMPVLTTALSA